MFEFHNGKPHKVRQVNPVDVIIKLQALRAKIRSELHPDIDVIADEIRDIVKAKESAEGSLNRVINHVIELNRILRGL